MPVQLLLLLVLMNTLMMMMMKKKKKNMITYRIWKGKDALNRKRIGSPFKHPWWTAFTDSGPEPRCLDEWLTVEISNSIREKPDWKTKYKNEEIVTKWKQKLKNNVKTKPNI